MAADGPPGEGETSGGSEPVVTRTRAPRPPAGAPRARPPSRARIRLRRAVALLALAVVVFAAWFAIELFQPFAGAGSGSGSVTIAIPSGADAHQIGDLLAARGVVSSGFFFELRAILDGDRPRLRAGTFTLRHGMSYAAALHELTTTVPRDQPTSGLQAALTVPPGFTRVEIAARARADGLAGSYLAATRAAAGFDPRAYGAPRDTPDLEGFLFPDTYDVERGEPVGRLVGQQLAAFRQHFDSLDFARARAAGLTRYDVLIVASMIEREAALPGDRALVSAVIYNRLRDGMPLGIDATLRYYLGDYDRPLTAAQLALDTPYNTRLHRGLPPTPISNPGLASLQAAAHPAHVSFLYYVDEPWTCGKLAFATTYARFVQEEDAYEAARARNGERAPTTCR